MNIYVGNLPYTATEEALRQLFEEFGDVTSVSIIMDRETGRSRGFAFVEMATDNAGALAIKEVNGREWNGRNLTANEARPREQRPRTTFGGAPRSGGGDSGFSRERSDNWGGGGGGGGDRSARSDSGRGNRREHDRRRGGNEGNFRKRSTSRDNDRSWSVDDDDDF